MDEQTATLVPSGFTRPIRQLVLMVAAMLFIASGVLLSLHSVQINPLFYPLFAAYLLLAVAALYIASNASRNVARNPQQWRTALVTIAYGVLATFEMYVQVALPQTLWACLGLASSVAIIAVGCLSPRHLSFLATSIVLVVATFCLMKAAQLEMFVNGTAEFRYTRWAIPEWTYQLGMLITLLLGWHRTFAPSSQEPTQS